MDLTLSFMEEHKKDLLSRLTSAYNKDGIDTEVSGFSQAVVSPHVLRDLVSHGAEGRLVAYRASDRDIDALLDLFNRVAARQALSLTMTADRLRHHVLQLPRGRTYLVEERGVATGFICFYVMDVFKAGGLSSVVVVDFLIADGTREAMRVLLGQAAEFMRESGARGIVLENATYLDEEARRYCGIVSSTRRMFVVTRSRVHRFSCDGSFLSDVK